MELKLGKLYPTPIMPHEKKKKKNRGRMRLRGMVFTMDRTLTVPMVNFTAMYKAVLED